MIDFNKIVAAAVIAVSGFQSAGAEKVKQYELNVNDFTELKVIGSINVDYYTDPDSAGFVTFESAENVAPMIMVSNKKGKVEIHFVNETGVPVADMPLVKIRSKFLTKVENTGDSTVRVMTAAPCPSFTARAVGNGRLVIRDITANDVSCSVFTGSGIIVAYGACSDASLSLTGTGSIQADGLKATDVKCRNTGTGTIGCWATDFLTVSGAGSGKIYYRGTPKVKKSLALGVKIESLESPESGD